MSDESPSRTTRFFSRVLEELGLTTIYNSPRDTKLLCIQRFVRLFAYGGSTLILVSYLSALDIPDSRIGLFMTLTLIGDVVISLLLTLIADALGRRSILILGAALMSASGVVFGLTGNYWILLAAAIFGVISPSGNEIGPFRAIEESTLAHLTPAAVRSDIFAWYTLIGSAGTALGIMCCGWAVRLLVAERDWNYIEAYRFIFFIYAAIGLIKLTLTCALSKQVEVEKEEAQPTGETAPLLPNGNTEQAKKSSWKSLLPQISKESRVIVINLCFLFALDNFASGLAPLSWVTNFFKRKFHLQEGQLGSLFFVTSIIAAGSTLVASSLAKRIGNVKTMVFTHLPSAVFLALIPIPSSAPLAMMFLILRSCTQSMDVAPRSAFLATIVLPNERTAVMGVINVVKTASQSVGPLVTGLLVERNLFWIAFVMAGSGKAMYDIGMLILFAERKSREEQAAEQPHEEEQGDEEER